MKKSGETLLEIMIALGIAAVVLISVFSMLSITISTNVNVENRIIALNLAREGIEVVRNVRDTNWLRFSGSRRENWMCYDVMNGVCRYRVRPNEEYFVVDPADAQPLQKIFGSVPLNINISSSSNENFRLQLYNGLYQHNVSGTNTDFYRQIILREESDDTCDCTPNCQSCEQVRVKAVAKIQWREDKKIRNLELESYLYDFFERDSY